MAPRPPDIFTIYGVRWEVWYDASQRTWYFAQCDQHGRLSAARHASSREWALIYMGMEAEAGAIARRG